MFITCKCEKNVLSSLTREAPTLQNDQKHSNNSTVTVDKLFECIWPFYGVVGA